ncbi:hypothetical protein PAXRUDRAFT_21494 [Paxillus rubicundulus Ve08.2h10]|uniref:Uncharacterized protein n=1 Tax=Paxillus rubicundulus Ve08.2h10 TaxID=930991 RepID=A0A0D0CBK9_9AGAM|nr:hypothetical protein PAXRUDRAFT_21494 [Paxillus rubicundulus Ve08.2h10]
MDSERELQLRGRGKVEVRTPGSQESGGTNSGSQESGGTNSGSQESGGTNSGSQESGVGVPVLEFTDHNGLPVTIFHLPSTKCDPSDKDTQCAPLNIPSDPIKALLNHLTVNNPALNDHIFAWRHPQSGLRPLSKSKVTKHIA